MVREWRHLKLLKRAGRGHDPTGVMGTTSGGLALLCPACPQPNINLPDNWEDAPKETRYVSLLFNCTFNCNLMIIMDSFLYKLILAIDANFRLKNRFKGNVDDGLGTGWAYFVASAAYKAYLKKFVKQNEVREIFKWKSSTD